MYILPVFVCKATFCKNRLFEALWAEGCHLIGIIAVIVCMVEEALREGLEGGSRRPGKGKPKRGFAFRREKRRQWSERHGRDTDVWISEGRDGIRGWRNPLKTETLWWAFSKGRCHNSIINKKHKKWRRENCTFRRNSNKTRKARQDTGLKLGL